MRTVYLRTDNRVLRAYNVLDEYPEKAFAKQCPQCKVLRIRSEFYKSDTTACGMFNICKNCACDNTRKRYKKITELRKRIESIVIDLAHIYANDPDMYDKKSREVISLLINKSPKYIVNRINIDVIVRKHRPNE